MIRLRSQLDYLHWDRPCATTADIGADGADNPRRADRARVAERADEVDDDEEDEVGELRATGGDAAARDEAGAATVAPAPLQLTSAPAG